MKRRVRTTFLVLGTTCFLAMTSGLVLHFHLAHLDDPAEHDAAHCPLCQQLFFSSKKDFTADPEPTDIELEPVGRIMAVQPATPIHQTFSNHCNPRAPPA